MLLLPGAFPYQDVDTSYASHTSFLLPFLPHPSLSNEFRKDVQACNIG